MTQVSKHLTYGDDALESTGGSISRHATKTMAATGNVLIDGVLSGYAWSGSSLTYSFPDSVKDYSYQTQNNEKFNGFGAVNINIERAAKFILDSAYGNSANNGFSVEGFTKLSISEGSDSGSTIKYAESSVPSTAWGYYPSTTGDGGDVWFGPSGNHETALAGNYAWMTVIHETGHALGLKHGHETDTYGALPTKYDSLETSIMTYRSFVGDEVSFYKVEQWGGPQTFMMADIAALQRMYGADFTTNSGDTIYKWKPTSGDTLVNGVVAIHPGGNRIFATIWDGGGSHDKYDLSAYKTGVSVNLHAGSHSKFSSTQISDLGANSSDGAGKHMASGNIYNALLYKGDTRSLIEDASGGSGNDSLAGNQVKNILRGNAGNDKLYGYEANDTLYGGAGKDVFVFRAGWDHDTIRDFKSGEHDRIDISSFNWTKLSQVKAHAENDGANVIIDFGHGDTLTIANRHESQLHTADFIF